jgi:hypothetical protein
MEILVKLSCTLNFLLVAEKRERSKGANCNSIIAFAVTYLLLFPLKNIMVDKER